MSELVACHRNRLPQGIVAALLAFSVLFPASQGSAQTGAVVTQQQLQPIEMRLDRVERLFDSGVLTEMVQSVDHLQSEVRQLRGQVEQLENELRILRSRQRDQLRGIDDRLALVEGGAGMPAEAAEEPAPVVSADALPDAEEQDAYQEAFERLMAGDYPAAIDRLEAFLERHPAGFYSANALFWLAEAKYAGGDFEGALTDYRAVRTRFPESDKAPDALLKIGYSHFELGDAAAAREALNQVVADYPGTTLSRLAQDRLRRLEGR
jgi:tol-pal system protein YbgF